MVENFNAADETQVKKLEKKEKVGRDKEIDDLKHLLTLPQFRRFAHRLVSFCGPMRDSFDMHSGKMNYLTGQASIGRFILSELEEADQKFLFKMMEEGKTNVRTS